MKICCLDSRYTHSNLHRRWLFLEHFCPCFKTNLWSFHCSDTNHFWHRLACNYIIYFFRRPHSGSSWPANSCFHRWHYLRRQLYIGRMFQRIIFISAFTYRRLRRHRCGTLLYLPYRLLSQMVSPA